MRAQTNGEEHAKREAEDGQPEAVEHDHRQHVAHGRAERQTNADFRRPLADGERHHAVNADRGEREREIREDREAASSRSGA